MTALERIKELSLLDHQSCHECEKDDMDFILRAFHVMREIAIELEKSDFHLKLLSEEIDDIFNTYMNMEKQIPTVNL